MVIRSTTNELLLYFSQRASYLTLFLFFAVPLACWQPLSWDRLELKGLKKKMGFNGF